MSAVAVGEVTPSEQLSGHSVYKFVQKVSVSLIYLHHVSCCQVPVASYLIAIVVGCLEKRDLSERCAVWSEPSVADKAAYEFAEVCGICIIPVLL
jgi:hypothetical protein